MKKLKFNFLITSRDTHSKLIKFLKKKGYEKYFLFYGKGSASSVILDYLGIGETEKVVLVYPTNEEDAKVIINFVKESEFLKDTIVFRCPIKGISSKKSLDYFLKGVTINE